MEDESPLILDGSQHQQVLEEEEEQNIYKEIPYDIRNSDADSVEDEDNLVDIVPSESNSVGITWYKAAFLMVNAGLGAGLLNFPQAFHQTGGIASGNFSHLIFVTFALGSLIILAICGSEKCNTYQAVVKQLCGPKWSIVASVVITLYCFITCVTFIIIIGDQFDRVFASFLGSQFCHHWYLNRKFTMIASSLLLIFPCCLKRIDGMQLMSYVGVVSIWYLVVVIVVEMQNGSYNKGEVLVWDVHFYEIFNALPTICFGYQCHVSSIPIYSCMKKRDSSILIKACASAMVVCFIVYTIGANCGYLTFGSLVNSDVLLSYDAKKPHVLVAVILLAIKSWTTYPILLFCVREAVSDLYIEWRDIAVPDAVINEPFRRKAIAAMLWVTSILLAVFTPNLNIVVKLLGSLAALFILVFPGMCLLSYTLRQVEKNGTLLSKGLFGNVFISIIYIAVGTFTFGLAFSLGLEAILYPITDVPVCT